MEYCLNLFHLFYYFFLPAQPVEVSSDAAEKHSPPLECPRPDEPNH